MLPKYLYVTTSDIFMITTLSIHGLKTIRDWIIKNLLLSNIKDTSNNDHNSKVENIIISRNLILTNIEIDIHIFVIWGLCSIFRNLKSLMKMNYTIIIEQNLCESSGHGRY